MPVTRYKPGSRDLQMKTDRMALLWGTLIGVAIVAGTTVVVFRFPNFRLPFNSRYAVSCLASCSLFLMLVVSYRKLWKRRGFWGLLAGFCGVYWSIAVHIAAGVGGLRLAVFYGITGAVAAGGFGLAMVGLYHQTPDVPSWIGLPR